MGWGGVGKDGVDMSGMEWSGVERSGEEFLKIHDTSIEQDFPNPSNCWPFFCSFEANCF